MAIAGDLVFQWAVDLDTPSVSLKNGQRQHCVKVQEGERISSRKGEKDKGKRHGACSSRGKREKNMWGLVAICGF